MRRLGVALVVGVLFTSGCGGNSASRLHSPAEAFRVFRADGVPITRLEWMQPRAGAGKLGGVLRSSTMTRTGLLLAVTAWASIDAAQRYEATLPRGPVVFGHAPHALRVGNVVAAYAFRAVTRASRALVARVSAAMSDLAATAGVRPPPDGFVPLATVDGNAATTVDPADSAWFQPYDWWCRSELLYISGKHRGNVPECAPWDATGVDVHLDTPDLVHYGKRVPVEIKSPTPARRVGTTHGSRLQVYSFRFGPARSVPGRTAASLLSLGQGARFPGSRWLCAAHAKPSTLVCYRTVGKNAETPIIVLDPGRRQVSVETIAPPHVLNSQGINFEYTFYA